MKTVVFLTVAVFSSRAAIGGGYLTGIRPVVPALSWNNSFASWSAAPSYNNQFFTSLNLISSVNNDIIRTPSTLDPISTVTGNNFHDEADVHIRGRNGLNYVFTRTYNSESRRTDRGIGYGWSHSYGMQLKSNDYGKLPNCQSDAIRCPENGDNATSSISYTDERGGEHNYLVNSNGTVSPPKGGFDQLDINSPSMGLHSLTFRNGTRYIFETVDGNGAPNTTAALNLKAVPGVKARLKAIENAWGDRLMLSYDASGRLAAVADNLAISGRTGLTFGYHADGHLKEVIDWTGRKWSFEYQNGDLTTFRNPLQQPLAYGYQGNEHLLLTITKPLTRDGAHVQTRFSYYRNGRGFRQTDSFERGDTLDYDLYRRATRVTDARGGVRVYAYDENGSLVRLDEPDGGILLFENQDEAIRSRKVDALGYSTAYSYRSDKTYTGPSDVHGNVTRELDALGRTSDLTYGPLDQIASSKDKRGTTSTTSFASATSGCDYLNRPKETRISALGAGSNVLLASYCWNANATPNHTRQYLDASRYRETRFTYEATSNGLNVSQEQVVGMPSGVCVTKTYTYDALGRKKTETLKRRVSPTSAALIDLITSYEYDALDRVVKVTDPLGNEVMSDYDANGRVWKITHRYREAGGTYEVRDVLTRTFDAADRVKTDTDVDGNVTTYSYDEAGNLIAVLDAEGHTTRYEYDAMNRRTAVIDATGYRTETSYSLRGDVTALTNPKGERVRFEVDALGRKTAAIDAKGYRSELAYDENGNLTCIIDANAQAGLQPKNSFGCSESRQYDELNRVTRVIDALDGETSFTYDLAGNRLSVKDAENKTWSFAYDDLGRLISETDYINKVISYKPDEAGNVYEKTNRLNEVTRYTFDNGNRVMRVDYLKDGTFETFGFDAAGNRNAAANGTVSYTFTWDRLNRLTGKTDSRGRSMSFTYDKVGNILTKTTYQGSTTSYVYNAANRLVMLRNPDYTQVDYQYDGAGRLLSRVTANGARMTQSLDANGWLSEVNQYDAANALVSSTSYTRDRMGNITAQTDSGGTTSYTLDALYRLTQADYPGTANDELFAYDKVGNRKSYTKGSLSANASTRYYVYAAGSNRLAEIRIGSTSGTLESGFTHDFEGRLTAQTGVGAKTLSWDAKGRVKTVGAESYSYDPMDYRIGRTGGSQGNRRYFLEGEHLESVETGSVLKERYFRGVGTDELVAGWLQDSDGKTRPYLFHHDQVTSVTAVTGHNGGTTQSLRYSAFGQSQSGTGASPNRLKYSGREDDGTGLYYYRARYYDPVIGRFISEDPLGFAAGDVNFYAYVGNNPVNANDPSGHAAMQVGGAIVGAVGGLLTQGGIDLARGSPSSFADYAGAFTGGAAGGAAAATCGPVCAGATAGAVSSATTQAIDWVQGRASSALNAAGNFVIDTALGAVGGKVAGEVVPYLFKNYVSNPIKGAIGEAMTWLDLTFSGRGVSGSQVGNTFFGKNGRESTFDFRTADGTFVEAKFGTSQLNRPTQKTAADYWAGLDQFELQTWSYPIVSGIGGSSFSAGAAGYGGSAGGGFLIYPNKSNTNMSQTVYSK
ncbi:RHS repeat-associated core domain-containing protein [Methyloversatilis thermotolerans]|uniref:RHS repeat-associated core domain-containing protein n=1 Tax=Methyloversatilis thermotolerans TaxID=1346290 RepID=UPI001E51C95F|nr:RHS repeat-associated core domain-containing protein [Methyloversatilis thermotolerans]